MISAADPAALPTTDVADRRHIAAPNQFPLPANEWTTVPVHFPSIVIIDTASAATIYAVPGKSKNADTITRAEYYSPIQIGATKYLFYFPALKEWQIKSDVEATSAVIKDAHDGVLPVLHAISSGIWNSPSGPAIRNADADNDFVSTLLGVVTNSRAAMWNGRISGAGGDWIMQEGGPALSLQGGVVSSLNYRGLATLAALVGYDSTGGGGAGTVMNAIEARNLDADADVAAALIGLLTNSRVSALGASDYVRLRALTAAAAASDETLNHMLTQSLVRGIDSSASATARSKGIEGRLASGYGGVAATAYNALAVAANIVITDAGSSTLRNLAGLAEVAGNNYSAAGVLQMRKAGYWGGLRDRRFNIAPNPTVVAVSTSGFTATDPSVLIVPSATNEVIVRRIWVRLAENTTQLVRAAWVADPDNRYTSGGVSFIPTNGFRSTNRGGAGTFTPTQGRVYDGATAIVATATDNDELSSGDKMFLALTGTVCPAGAEVSWEPEDDLIIPPSGTLLLYVWGEAAIDFTFGVETEVANVQ